MVVSSLPFAKFRLRVDSVREVVAAPEFLAVDAMAALDFPVLLRPTWLDVAVAHASRLHGQLKRERKLRPVVALDLPNGEREGVRQLAQKIEAGVVIESRVEPQHAHPRAIIQCGVLKDLLLRQPNDLDVHLDGVARVLLPNSFICRGRRRGVLARTGTPMSQNTR